MKNKKTIKQTNIDIANRLIAASFCQTEDLLEELTTSHAGLKNADTRGSYLDDYRL